MIPISDILSRIEKEKPVAFTKILNVFQKADSYPDIPLAEAEEMLKVCERIFRKSKNDDIRCNALRFLKFAVHGQEFLKKHAERVWDIYWMTLAEKNGNIRNAGVYLLSRYLFGMMMLTHPLLRKKKGRKKKGHEEETQSFQRLLATQYARLIEEHDRREEEEEPENDMIDYIPLPEDTDDTYLKTLRRGIFEFRNREQMEEWCYEYGIWQPIRPDFPLHFSNIDDPKDAKNSMQEVIRHFLRWIEENRGRFEEELAMAWDTFFGIREDIPMIPPEGNFVNVFAEYLGTDYPVGGFSFDVKNRKNFLSLFLEEAGNRLSDGAKVFAKNFALSHRGFYRITGVEQGMWLDLEDLFTKEKQRMWDVNLSKKFKKGKIIYSRLVVNEHGKIIGGGVGADPVSREDWNRLHLLISCVFECTKQDYKGMTMNDFLKWNSYIYYRELYGIEIDFPDSF